MIEIKNLKLSWEVEVSGTTDPVASKTGWDPLNSLLSKYKTAVMSENGDEIVIKPTRYHMAFHLFPFVLGLIMLIMGTTLGLLNGGILAILSTISIFGSITLILYATLLKGIKKTIIDKKYGFYHQNRTFKTPLNKDLERHGRLEDIHAIQLLEINFSPNFYELNLIFTDGSRLNLMAHGILADIEKSARKLAKLFNIQIWKAIC